MENVRTASQPSTGAGRDTIRNAIGALIGAGIAWLLPEGTDPQVRVATGAVVWGLVVSPVLALWGKWLRGRGINAVFALPLVLLLFPLVGCFKAPTGIRYWPNPDAGKPSLKVDIDPGGYARACLAMRTETEADGTVTVDVVLQHDGESNWIGGRAAGQIAYLTVAGVMSSVNAPGDALRHLVGVPMPEPEPVSRIHGCEGVEKFYQNIEDEDEDEDEDDDEDPDTAEPEVATSD